MMTGKDKETGLGLSDESIKNNVRANADYAKLSLTILCF